MRSFLVLLLPLLLASCYTANKATRQVWKAQGFYPQVVAKACGSLYTTPDSVFANEVLLKGDTIIVSDTFLQTDTVSHTLYKHIYHTLHTTDTLVRNKFVQARNKALEQALQAELTNMSNKLAGETRAMKLWRLAALICIGIIAIYIAIRTWL